MIFCLFQLTIYLQTDSNKISTGVKGESNEVPACCPVRVVGSLSPTTCACFSCLFCVTCAYFSCFRFVGSLWNMYSFICAVGCLVVKQLIKSVQGDHFEE